MEVMKLFSNSIKVAIKHKKNKIIFYKNENYCAESIIISSHK